MIPLIWRQMARLAGRPWDRAVHALDVETICPAEVQEVPEAIYLREHLSRIQGFTEFSSREEEDALLHDRVAHHRPTRLLRFGPATLFSGGIWGWQGRRHILRDVRDVRRIPAPGLRRAVVTDSDFAHRYFGHWLQDDVPASLLGDPARPAISLREPKHAHSAGYTRLFNLDSLVVNSGHVEDLYVIEDFTQNSHKVKRCRELRRRLGESLSLRQSASGKRVFMARGVTGRLRRLLNEPELVSHLERRGFEILYPERLAVEDLVRGLWNAELVITVEGSALNHATFSLARNGAMLLLQPPQRVNHIGKGIFDAMGFPYGFYVCAESFGHQSFVVDSFRDLDRLSDLLLEEAVRRRS